MAAAIKMVMMVHPTPLEPLPSMRDVSPFPDVSSNQTGIATTRVMSQRVVATIQVFNSPIAVANSGGPAASGPTPHAFHPLQLGGMGTECDLCGQHADHLW